jgi:hypothetical protein
MSARRRQRRVVLSIIGENHWHGAAPDRFMAHIAMQQSDDSGGAGGMVSWGEHVTDEQYAAGRSA